MRSSKAVSSSTIIDHTREDGGIEIGLVVDRVRLTRTLEDVRDS
jgi:hypothetical protein